VEDIFVKAIKEEGEEIGKTELFGVEINKGIKLREHVIELMDFVRERGIIIWIVTASPEIVIRAALNCFKIDANLIGVRNVVVDGKFTADLESPTPITAGKVECIKKFIDKMPLIGVGDSINDLPMLEYCKIKVVVDRQNPLAEKAIKEGWFLI
jgi:HAD superfamily phosphoserine phosphatase-like hydrolase